MRYIRAILWVLLLLASIYLMAGIVLPYILPPFPQDIDFLASKPREQRLTWWMAAFYIHITSSLWVLLSGALQFWPWLLRRYPAWHRALGKSYVFGILFLAAPSGLLMGLRGNGGQVAVMGFIWQAVLWWLLSWVAYRQARKGDWRGHEAFMWRSYALSLSAISLRAMMTGWWWLEPWYMLRYPFTYIFVAWFSWVFNLLLAEAYLHWRGLRA